MRSDQVCIPLLYWLASIGSSFAEQLSSLVHESWESVARIACTKNSRPKLTMHAEIPDIVVVFNWNG